MPTNRKRRRIGRRHRDIFEITETVAWVFEFGDDLFGAFGGDVTGTVTGEVLESVRDAWERLGEEFMSTWADSSGRMPWAWNQFELNPHTSQETV